MKRLGLEKNVSAYLPPERFLPAAAQGAIAVQVRAGEQTTLDWVRPLDDSTTHAAVKAERALLRRLEGGCQVPVGALAVAAGHRLRLSAVVCSLDGQRSVEGYREGWINESEGLGRLLAEELLTQGGANILAELRGREEQRTL